MLHFSENINMYDILMNEFLYSITPNQPNSGKSSLAATNSFG